MHQHHRTIVFDKLKRKLRCRNISPHLVKNDLSKASKINRKSFKFSNSNNLQYLANGLPVVCMVALLGIMAYSINVGTVFDYVEKTYAIDGDDSTTTSPDPVATISVSPGGDHAASSDQPTLVAQTGMAYRSHAVNVNVKDVTKYSLQISYAAGEDNLRLMNSNAYLAGAGGKTPASMADNTWGFAWVTDKDADYSLPDDQMTYYTMPQTGTLATNLASGLLANADTYNDDFNGKLVFAAKFGDNATSGRYKTQVMLSLTASAKEVVTTLDDIFQMQQMTPEICASSVIGETTYLTDTRGGGYTNGNVEHSYQVTKLSDGNCWMGQNMNLTNKTITPADSNVASDYTIPAHSTSGWSISSSTSNKVYYANSNGSPSSGDYSNNDTYRHGAYYTWYAATAGTSTSATTQYAQAPSSICPKGWRLPSAGIDDNATADVKTAQYGYSYNKLVAGNNYLKVGTNSDWTNKVQSNGYWLGGKVADAKDAAFFPAAGLVGNGSLGVVGSVGYYWSSTARDGAGTYYLNFISSDVNPSSTDNGRYSGLSVRCVAERGLVNIDAMQEMTSDICSNTAVGFSKALIDSRDGKEYQVTKLKDGNCWMTQDLRLELNGITLTPSDSNVSKNWASNTGASSQWSTNNQCNAQNTSACNVVKYYNGSKTSEWTSGNNLGYYYSWCAATANTCLDAIDDWSEAISSICPKGWRLPSRAQNSTDIKYKYSFQQLFDTAGFKEGLSIDEQLAIATSGPYNFMLAGNVDAGYNGSGLLEGINTHGDYWTGTSGGTGSADYVSLSTNEAYGGIHFYGGWRADGNSIRCVAPSTENL